MLHVKLYDSSEPLNVGDMNSAGPGRPDISMYFLVRPNELSATQLRITEIQELPLITVVVKCVCRTQN